VHLVEFPYLFLPVCSPTTIPTVFITFKFSLCVLFSYEISILEKTVIRKMGVFELGIFLNKNKIMLTSEFYCQQSFGIFLIKYNKDIFYEWRLWIKQRLRDIICGLFHLINICIDYNALEKKRCKISVSYSLLTVM